MVDRKGIMSNAPTTRTIAIRLPGSTSFRRKLTTRDKWLLRIGFLALILVSWEIYGQDVSRALLAPPSEIIPSFFTLYIVEPVMWEALGTTLFALGLGLFIAIALGIVLGILIGLNRTVELVVGPYISFLFAIPSIALIPLLVVWFGIDLQLRVVLVVISAIFPVIINTATGIRQTSIELIETSKSFNGSPWQLLTTVRIPASLPFMFAGVNLALSLALAGVVVAEMTAAITGLGGLIITYSRFFQTANLFVPILTLMAMSIAINAGVARLETVLMPWRKDARTGRQA